MNNVHKFSIMVVSWKGCQESIKIVVNQTNISKIKISKITIRMKNSIL